MTRTAAVVFDLGGVLIELDTPGLVARLGSGLDEPGWRSWMAESAAARAWESGQCDFEAFAKAAVHELQLTVGVGAFQEAFTAWIRGPYPDSAALVAGLPGGVGRYCLSSSNEVHWARMAGFGVDRWFDQAFLSCRLGLVKPDPRLYERVRAAIGLPAERLLFLDDSPPNVEGARRAGWQAELTCGPEQVRAALLARSLLDASPGPPPP